MGLALQDKHVTEANRHFEALERGEIVRIEGAEAKGDGLGLGAQSRVIRVAAPGEVASASSPEHLSRGTGLPPPGSES